MEADLCWLPWHESCGGGAAFSLPRWSPPLPPPPCPASPLRSPFSLHLSSSPTSTSRPKTQSFSSCSVLTDGRLRWLPPRPPRDGLGMQGGPGAWWGWGLPAQWCKAAPGDVNVTCPELATTKRNLHNLRFSCRLTEIRLTFLGGAGSGLCRSRQTFDSS